MVRKLIRKLLGQSNVRRIKRVRNQVVHWGLDTFFPFGVQDFASLLRQIGIVSGDVVMVHSSFDSFNSGGFQGSIGDIPAIIETLQDAVGPMGALLMPTLPFSGDVVSYALTNPVFDVRRTPSQMGILTEVFRRMPGVTRSLHPTHPVAGFGAKAPQILQAHPDSSTPCGANSPFAWLYEVGGKVLLLGVDIRSMTFFHFPEEELEPKMSFNPFTRESFTLKVRDQHGATRVLSMRLYEPSVGKRRDTRLMVPDLKRMGYWREARLGLLKAIVLEARHVREVMHRMADEGRFCYHPLSS